MVNVMTKRFLQHTFFLEDKKNVEHRGTIQNITTNDSFTQFFSTLILIAFFILSYVVNRKFYLVFIMFPFFLCSTFNNFDKGNKKKTKTNLVVSC